MAHLLNNFFYAALGITLLIVDYRAYRREQGVSLNALDMQFAKESVHEGLRCLGYAVAPSSASDMNKQKDAVFTGILALKGNLALAGEFNINDTQLWDGRNELYGSNADAKLIMESAARFGLQTCRRVQDGGELRTAIQQLA